ncbi:MAG: choice-of-anchor D domain-containing protein [Planctomycetota bacterium]|jgi:hypothetical protein
MRRFATLTLFLALYPAACSGGGSSAPTPLVERAESFALVRGDVATVREIKIVNPFGAEATVELLEPPTGGFSVPANAFPTVVSAGATRSVLVTFDPAGDEFASGEMLVRFKTEKNSSKLRLGFDATIETPRIQLVTSVVLCGDVNIGESAAREIRIRNSSGVTPVRFSRLGVLPMGFSITGSSQTLDPGETATVTLTWTPKELAEHEFTIFFDHDAAGADLEVGVTAEATTWVAEIVTDLGTVPLVDGETDWIEVDVPPHAISLQLEATRSGVTIGLLEFQGPGGHVYENDETTGDYLWFSGPDVFTAGVPSSDREELKLVPGGGTYRFRLFLMSGSASNLDVRAIVHNRPAGIATGGRIDLNIFLAPGLGIDVADAEDETRLQGILARADEIFGKIGLELGSVSYFALTNSDFDRIGDTDEFSEMLKESSQAGEERLNLFFVTETLGGSAVGVSARIGGPRLNGTIVSGVMVDYDWGSAQQAGYVTAHEIGHFLGLLHTTSQNGDHDLIDDTAECPASGTNSECATTGNGYLMHWKVLSTEPVITDGQALVVLGHPLIAPIPASPQLTAYDPPPTVAAASSGLLGALVSSALPEGWCGTPGCCGSKK